MADRQRSHRRLNVALETRPLDGGPPRSVPGARRGWRSPGITGVLGAVLAALSAAYLAQFLIEAVLRMWHPFPLDPTEPAVLEEVERIVRGQALYVPPTLEYVPLTYGPVSF